jgi:diguanylate cyclase (GGDEF)-like protein/PAS domain S-box-containing protein
MINKDNICNCGLAIPEDSVKYQTTMELSVFDVLELAPCVVFSFRFTDERSAVFDFVSAKISDLAGFSPKDVEENAAPFIERVHPDDADKFFLSAISSAESMELWCVEFRYNHYIKGDIWIERQATPVFGNCELIWEGVMLDITKRKQAQQRQYLLESAFEIMSDGIILFDQEGNILEINRFMCEMLDREKADLMGVSLLDLNPILFQDNLNVNWEEIVTADGKKKIQAISHTKSSVDINLEVSVSLIRSDDKLYKLACFRDISECEHIVERLRMAANVFDASREGIAITDKEGCILDVNPAFSKITGYSYRDVIGKNPSILSSGEHDDAFYKTMWSSLKNEGAWSGEIKNRRKYGEQYTEHLNIVAAHDDTGEVQHYIGIFSDISQLKQQEERLEYLVNHDVLTNLPNHLLLCKLVSNALEVANETNSLIGLLYIDLDAFKSIKDNYGHEISDSVLVEISTRLSEQVRSTDVVAHIGGDEFVVLLTNASDADECALTATRLLDAICSPITLNAKIVNLTASIGIYLHNRENQGEAEVLIRHAGQAMYMAKSSGRNQYAFYDEYKLNDALENDRTVHELRQALSDDQFAVYYQPIVDLDSGCLIKAEALVRWDHPKLGMVPPSEFIPVSENGGLIHEIGDLVFQNAVRVAYELNNLKEIEFDEKIQISINRSPRQFFHRDGVERWINHLKEQNIPGELLCVEITEGLLLDDWPDIQKQLNQLRDHGISISLDDFGTGYSALSYLTKFKIDYLKVDRTFVNDIVEDADYQAIVNSIIAMAKQLEIKTIGEGVESLEQEKLLKEVCCDMAQGYLYAKPMPEEEFIEFVLDNRARKCDK